MRKGPVQLRRHTERPSYVAMSAIDTRETIVAAIERGAAGFIPKKMQTGAALVALRAVIGGNAFLPPQILGAVAPETSPVTISAGTAAPNRS
jgi:DNA-binding NarL/FixJ family response regulator